MSGALNPVEIRCSSADDVFTALKRFESAPLGWIYRGQHCAAWPLQPALERYVPIPNVLTTELRMYDDFRAKAHLYTTELPEWGDTVSWLASMQHHGVPTRLLDWTSSSHVALFFSVYESIEPDVDSALWAINLEKLSEHVASVGRELFPLINGIRYSDSRHFRRAAFLHDAESGELNLAWENNPGTGFVVPILPQFQSLRLSSQQGLFLFNCNYKLTFEDSLGSVLYGSRIDIQKLVFPSSLRDELLSRLFHINIHPISMFPDLEGLASFIALKQRLFGHYLEGLADVS